jgi:undecaprenyl-diphosphatase
LRVYFGVHWLTDIICGFLLGVLSFAIANVIWVLCSPAVLAAIGVGA